MLGDEIGLSGVSFKDFENVSGANHEIPSRPAEKYLPTAQEVAVLKLLPRACQPGCDG
jgi:hypothetical protein